MTLLFSIERYEAVIDAYQRGLSLRAQEGTAHRDRIGGVVFRLRIDTKVDAELAERSSLRWRRE